MNIDVPRRVNAAQWIEHRLFTISLNTDNTVYFGFARCSYIEWPHVLISSRLTGTFHIQNIIYASFLCEYFYPFGCMSTAFQAGNRVQGNGIAAAVSEPRRVREKTVLSDNLSHKSLEAATNSSQSSAPRGQLALGAGDRRASERSFPLPLLKSLAAGAAGANTARRTGMSQGFGLSSRQKAAARDRELQDHRPPLSMAMIIKIKMRLREIRMRIRSRRKKEREERMARGELKVANTYQLEPKTSERFRKEAVEAMLEGLLRFWLADVSYQQKLAARVCGSLADDAVRKVKAQFRLSRYKLVALVTIGSRFPVPTGAQGPNDGRRSVASRKVSQLKPPPTSASSQAVARKQSAAATATPEGGGGAAAGATASASGGQIARRSAARLQRGSIAITSRCFGAAEFDCFATAAHTSEDLFATVTLYAFYFE